VIADKLPLTLDRNGAGKLTIDNVPQARQPRELLLEATYADPNGEVQTLRSTPRCGPPAWWPASRPRAGCRPARRCASRRWRCSTMARPPPTPAQVQAIARITTTTRKRMVGGFYSYDNQTETKDLGTVCTGKSDSRGLLLCDPPRRAGRGGTGRDGHRPGGQHQRGGRFGVGDAPGRAVVWRRRPRPHRPAAREKELPAR
jgi:hypothetical protein